ncbi:Hypothetical_protein [Hexamita inflata]|uniref:Hypothetical_protein n=1 Tax=Hexamita inflata TaxID=28002 RepID=A0ABP1GWP8_9EUKA
MEHCVATELFASINMLSDLNIHTNIILIVLFKELDVREITSIAFHLSIQKHLMEPFQPHAYLTRSVQRLWGDGITWDEAGENFVKRAVKKGPIQLCFTAYIISINSNIILKTQHKTNQQTLKN